MAIDDGRGFLLGYASGPEKQSGEFRRGMVRYHGDRHLLTVSPTRGGKGVAAIIPNLLRYRGSALVIDPKGENAKITGKQREQLGQVVHAVDPWDITGRTASRFNPMEWLDPEDQDIGENALMLADAIIVPSPGGKDQFWDQEAKALAWGLILYVALDPEEQGQRDLGRVRDLAKMSWKELDPIAARMFENKTNAIVSTTAQRLLGMDPKLRSNVFTTLQSHTHFLDSPRIRASISGKSDFRFEDLKTQRMTVYLALPADRLATFGAWFRLLVQQAITVNARNIESPPEQPILFLLDEMQNLGNLTMVSQAYSLMAGFGMQLWGIVQDFGVLKDIYGDRWESFVANSGVLQYFGSRDKTTADYFSHLCGVTTVRKTSFSITKAISRVFGGGGGGSDTQSNSQNMDVVQKPLVYPDQLMVMPRRAQLLLIENYNPVWGQKIEWFSDTRFSSLGVNLKAVRRIT